MNQTQEKIAEIKYCMSCKYCKEGKLFRDDEVSSSYCNYNKKNKRAINSHHLVEEKPDWCPLKKTGVQE